MSTTVGGVRVEVEKDERSEACAGAWWRTRHRRVCPNAGWSLALRRAAGKSLTCRAPSTILRHAYEQGSADSALGP